MALSKEICGVLAAGVQKEKAAHDFYVGAAEKTLLPVGKKMFKMLAAEETKHEKLLESWSTAGACPVDAGLDDLAKDLMRKGKEKLAREVEVQSGDIQAIEIGQDMERKSIAFYAEAALKAGDKASRDLFLRLEGEEKNHLALLTDLYEYMRNPNLWSVRNERAHFDS